MNPSHTLPSFLRGSVNLLCLFALCGWTQPELAAQTPVPVPAPGNARIATTQVRVVPDAPGWTYNVGEPVKFQVSVTWDGQPLDGVPITYTVGPEMLPAEERTAIVPAGGLTIEGGTLQSAGFIRCIVHATVEGKPHRSVATAGFSPENITPTQVEPADFEAFWEEGKAKLRDIPLDARLQLIPEASTGTINVYHVSFRTWSISSSTRYEGRVYGIYCEPKAPGKYPAILGVPGAGVRPYSGMRDLAEKGAITLQIGIHGIPVTHDPEIYDQMRTGALAGYPVYNLDDPKKYYYHRVYLGCVRANDFLTSRESWDGKNLGVTGGSQGGQLTLVTTALDPRVTAAAALYPAYCDVTGYLHGRAGGWPHMMKLAEEGHRTPEKIRTTGYYDAVNFARRVRVPIQVGFGYNDETCPPTSMFAAYNQIPGQKRLLLALEMGHTSIPEINDATKAFILEHVGIK